MSDQLRSSILRIQGVVCWHKDRSSALLRYERSQFAIVGVITTDNPEFQICNREDGGLAPRRIDGRQSRVQLAIHAHDLASMEDGCRVVDSAARSSSVNPTMLVTESLAKAKGSPSASRWIARVPTDSGGCPPDLPKSLPGNRGCCCLSFSQRAICQRINSIPSMQPG